MTIFNPLSATSFSPVCFYALDGNFSETSGNGHPALVPDGPDIFDTSLGPGLRGKLFVGETASLNLATTPNDYRITGDLTIQLIALLNRDTAAASSDDYFCAIGQNSEGSVDNLLYTFGTDNGSLAGRHELRYRAEFGSGSEITHISQAAFPAGVPTHLALVRENDDVTYYINGRQEGFISLGLTAPTGGSQGTFTVAGLHPSTNTTNMAIACLKIHNTALSSANILSEYNSFAGEFFPRVTA